MSVRLIPPVVLVLVLVLALAPVLSGAQDRPAPSDLRAAGAGEPGSLAAMLGRLPAAPFDQSSGTMVSYANYAAQLAAVGITMPEAADEAAVQQWGSATAGLPWIDAPQGLFWAASQREWRDDFGFDLAQVEQVVQLAQPVRLTLLRGRFDANEVRSAWGRTGYETRTIGGAAVAVFPEDAAFELIRVGASLGMRHAAILDDGTLVFSETEEAMAAVFAVAAGRAPALADQADVAMLLHTARPDLVSALIVAGGWLQHDPLAVMAGAGPEATLGIPDVDAIATQAAVQIAEARRLPPVRAVLFGMTAGGPRRPLGTDATALPLVPGQAVARFEITVLLPTRGGAERAVPVIEERLTSGQTSWTGEPYAELFPERAVRAAPDSPVVLIALSLGDGTSPAILHQMLVRRDLGFLAW